MKSLDSREVDLISRPSTTHGGCIFSDTCIVNSAVNDDESLKTAPSISSFRSSRQRSGSSIDSSSSSSNATQLAPCEETAGAALEADRRQQAFQILFEQSDSCGQSTGDKQLVERDPHLSLASCREQIATESENLLPQSHDSHSIQVPKIFTRPRANSACAYLIGASGNINSHLLIPNTDPKTTDSPTPSNYSSSWKSLRITSFNPQPTFISGTDQNMNVDERMIEEGSGGQEELVVTSQQLKLARDRSREKIRRIVAIVSIALTLLAVLLVTAFLALGSKLEKEAERNAQRVAGGGSGSPFADDSQRSNGEASESSQAPSLTRDSSPSSKDIAELITKADPDRPASVVGSRR